MSNWKKIGQMFEMREIDSFLKTHASNPLPVKLSNSIYRIFFSGRDVENRSSVGYVDFDMDSLKLTNICKDLTVQFGEKDSFYSHGISIGNSYSNNDREYILFMGWNIPKGEHWRGDIGQLELINKEILTVTSQSPFMGTDDEDKISLSYPFVLFHEGIYKMWYGSTITWKEKNGEMVHVIKYATSPDGVNWERHGIAIPFEIGKAQAFSRPSVIIENGIYHMWYSYRKGDGTKYRIGYSRSVDGLVWEDFSEKLGLTVSDNGWDSEMVCYPFVFKHGKKFFMLYNGNDFGRFGFGLATIDNL